MASERNCWVKTSVWPFGVGNMHIPVSDPRTHTYTLLVNPVYSMVSGMNFGDMLSWLVVGTLGRQEGVTYVCPGKEFSAHM